MVGTKALDVVRSIISYMMWTSIDHSLRHNKQANMQYILDLSFNIYKFYSIFFYFVKVMKAVFEA